MQRPGSEPTQSFALSIARQDGVQTLATCGSATLCSNANIGSTTSLLETCFIAFFCMVVMPLIGACGGVVCQLVAAVTVAMLSTIIAVGFKYALSTDNGSVHRLHDNAVQDPGHTTSTTIVTTGACPNNTSHSLEQSDTLVRDDSNLAEMNHTENDSTDLYETCFIALFCMVCLPLMGVAATIMMMVIATSEYFCYETVLQTLMIATTCAYIITFGVALSLVRGYISFYIGWVVYFEADWVVSVENKTLDTLDWIGLDSLADDISRLFDFISRQSRIRSVRFDREDTVHSINRHIPDLSWALDKTAAINYFQ